MLPFKHSFNPTTSTVGDPIHEYQDIQLFNNSTGDTQPIPCIFNQTKLTNVVDKADEYYISVVRWSADSILPQIIPEMNITYNTGPIPTPYNGLTNYVIGITANTGDVGLNTGDYVASYVIYNPDANPSNNYLQPDLQPTSQNEYYNNPYFWIANIYEFMECLNTALLYCVQTTTQDTGAAGGGWSITGSGDKAKSTGPVSAPKFYYNTTTGKIELLADQEEYGVITNGVKPKFSVIMNTELSNLLNTFYLQQVVKVQPPGGVLPPSYMSINWSEGTEQQQQTVENYYMYEIINTDFFNRNSYSIVLPGSGTGTSVAISVISQTNSSVPSMSPVNSIVFQTTAIPVNNTLTGAPAFLGQNLQATNALQNNSGVLTDFQVPLVSGTEYSGSMLYYVPSGEYRLLDLTANTPIQVLNIQVYWLDKIGNSHPFLIKNQGAASLKLMFRKKIYNGTF